jgi:hypothetical protein
MEEIDREKVKVGFMAYWKMLYRNGLIEQSSNLARTYQTSPDENPTNLTFICWALASRFFDIKQDPEVIWEQQAVAYLEKQILLEKSRWV